tara:strand:+ start:171 stop:737 length:567 start_codon:yes stop_codon:yes gene_type:complete
MDDIETLFFTQRDKEISGVQCKRCQELTDFTKTAYSGRSRCDYEWDQLVAKIPDLQESFKPFRFVKTFDATGCPITPSVSDRRWEEKTLKVRRGEAKIRYLEIGSGYFIQPLHSFRFEDLELFDRYWNLEKDINIPGSVEQDLDYNYEQVISEVPITFVEKVFKIDKDRTCDIFDYWRTQRKLGKLFL